MRYAKLDNDGAIVNFYAAPAPGTVPVNDDVGFGWIRRGDTWVPPYLASVDAARSWALERVDEVTASRTTVQLQDGITYSVDQESETTWNSLFRMNDIAKENRIPFWPQEFIAADGAVVVLDDEAEAKTLYLTLSFAVNQMRIAAIRTRHAIEDATTVDAVVSALQSYGGV